MAWFDAYAVGESITRGLGTSKKVEGVDETEPRGAEQRNKSETRCFGSEWHVSRPGEAWDPYLQPLVGRSAVGNGQK